VQGQAHARPDHRPVDPDELQVAPQEELQLAGRLCRVPAFDRHRDQVGELIVELVGEGPGSGLDHALQAVVEARV
jgi:hypothetical protein